jgi:uncharacterized protein with PIN domain
MSWGKAKIDLADKAFSLYIRTRDNWTCQNCGKYYAPPTNSLHCSHFVGRGKENTRFNERNADAMCFHCHQRFTSHPNEHVEWQVEKKGQQVVDLLILAGNTYCKKDRDMWKIYWTNRLNQL